MDVKAKKMACKFGDREDFARERLKVRRRLSFDDDEESPNTTPPPPPHHNHMVFEQNIGEFVKQKSQKWNFDFETGTPEKGPYEWIEVSKYNLTSVTNRILAVHVDLPAKEKKAPKSKNVLWEANENLKRKCKYAKIRNKSFKQTILKGDLVFRLLKF